MDKKIIHDLQDGKFWLAALILASLFAGFFTGQIEGEPAWDAIKWIFGSYVTGSAIEKASQNIKPVQIKEQDQTPSR